MVHRLQPANPLQGKRWHCPKYGEWRWFTAFHPVWTRDVEASKTWATEELYSRNRQMISNDFNLRNKISLYYFQDYWYPRFLSIQYPQKFRQPVIAFIWKNKFDFSTRGAETRCTIGLDIYHGWLQPEDFPGLAVCRQQKGRLWNKKGACPGCTVQWQWHTMLEHLG